MKNYKHRFIKMMFNHAPMKRADLTRRALSQLRIDMSTLNRMITQYKKEKLIVCKKVHTLGSGGKVPEVYSLTALGEKWIRGKDKEINRAKGG